MIHDGLPTTTRPWDLCIVGSGPVGISLAFEYAVRGKSVLILESGAATIAQGKQDASRAEYSDNQTHAEMRLAVCRALGGTSWYWGGRCVPFDDVDFVRRPFLPNADWPISHREVSEFYGSAAKYLLCGDNTFSIPAAALRFANGASADTLERWSTQSRLLEVHHSQLAQHPDVVACVNCTVTDLELSNRLPGYSQHQVKGLRVATPSGPAIVTAQEYVIAAGGLESTRLVLAFQRTRPQMFGGLNGPLGRYYMGHLSGKIANIILNDPAALNDLDFFQDKGSFVRRRLILDTETQIANEVMNTAFWPDNPAFYDSRHGSAVLSSVFLVLAFPPLGRRVLSEAIRLHHIGPEPRRIGRHLGNAILGAPRGAADMFRILRDRFLKRPRKPGFLIRNWLGSYALHYHAEQEPNPESRVRLADTKDEYGLPRLNIDFRYTQRDFESVVKSHKLLDVALRSSTLGKLEFKYPEAKLVQAVGDQASDGYHQAGTTRMGTDPAQSVVDENLKVHDLSNLYVASSSVFPSTGQANSTFLAVALACRLAQHLQAKKPNSGGPMMTAEALRAL